MSDASPSEQPVVPDEKFAREWLAIQQQEMLLRREEQNVRIEEIRSNEKIALASIAAQKETDIDRNRVFLSLYSKRFWLWLAAIIGLAALIVFSVIYGYIDIALKIIEIGGAATLAYFAGLNRGKAQGMESRPPPQD